MSERYALLFIAPLAFRNASAYLTRSSGRVFRPVFYRALKILRSLQMFMGRFNWTPSQKKDSPGSVALFNAADNAQYRAKTRRQFDVHLAMIRDLCLMPDSEIAELEHGHDNSQRARQLKSKLKDHTSACAVLDKPNVHRLREICHSTLDLALCVILVAELVLEERH